MSQMVEKPSDIFITLNAYLEQKPNGWKYPIFFQDLNAALQPHCLGWEDTAVPKRAAVANDASLLFTDEPWA